MKNNFNKYIGKVIQLKLPQNKQKSWVWIVKKRDDGRYIIKSPKKSTSIEQLHKKRNIDFGHEKLMPIKKSRKRYTRHKSKQKKYKNKNKRTIRNRKKNRSKRKNKLHGGEEKVEGRIKSVEEKFKKNVEYLWSTGELLGMPSRREEPNKYHSMGPILDILHYDLIHKITGGISKNIIPTPHTKEEPEKSLSELIRAWLGLPVRSGDQGSDAPDPDRLNILKTAYTLLDEFFDCDPAQNGEFFTFIVKLVDAYNKGYKEGLKESAEKAVEVGIKECRTYIECLIDKSSSKGMINHPIYILFKYIVLKEEIIKHNMAWVNGAPKSLVQAEAQAAGDRMHDAWDDVSNIVKDEGITREEDFNKVLNKEYKCTRSGGRINRDINDKIIYKYFYSQNHKSELPPVNIEVSDPLYKIINNLWKIIFGCTP